MTQLREIHPVILAGGRGSRLQRVVKDIPKPLVAVRGRPFVEWIVRFLARFGIDAVTISTGYLGEMIERHFVGQPIPGVQVSCIAEGTPLGTGGAFVHAARQSTRRPWAWLVLNGDSLIFHDLLTLARQLAKDGADAAILGRRVSDASRYGRLAVDNAGWLTAFAEKTENATAPGLINAGIYLFRPELLELFPERQPLSFEYDVFPELLQKGARIAVEGSDAPFLDIGTEETLALADDFIVHNGDQFI